MSSAQVPPSLRDIVADVLEISPDEVTPELNSNSAEGWDSFRHLQLVLSIEGQYGVQFDPQRIPELTSVSLIWAELLRKGAKL
jgi:acyl carrier protein